MVNFKKRLGGKKVEKPTDPLALYDGLDRAHDKGPLRPAQAAVLTEWYAHHRAAKEVIVKLHTGQGKTLIGLLMLQSQLNDGKGPCVYLCPDNFLIEQTCDQAAQFGIATCRPTNDLPDEFLNSDKILVTSVQKLFNGLTKFRLGSKSIPVGSLLMDDAHACSDDIRANCTIRIEANEPAYADLQRLFASDVEDQGVGTYADICNDKRDAFLPIPYWAWVQKESEVAKTLSNHSARESIKFAWPLLKDLLPYCQCVMSGAAIEIEPYIAPLSKFGSYFDAPHRIFMSATVTDDAFLVKGLQLLPETILNPLTYAKESWSGEKMVLLPSLISEDLTRELIVANTAPPKPKRRYGVVALTPGFAWTQDWKAYGAEVVDKNTVSKAIDALRKGEYENTVVLVNRYDGIDLPDATCRVLIFDSRPYSESLIDLYQESCRPNSEATLMRVVRTIEQGMGRSVRGEKDFSVVLVVGSDLTRLVRDKSTRKFLSPQTAMQVKIGLDISEMAREEIEGGEPAMKAFNALVNQCLGRDEDWKAFYAEQMESVKPAKPNERVLRAYAVELAAEQTFMAGDYEGATKKLQALLDAGSVPSQDKGWYLQEMARYNYGANRPESQRLQVAAHKQNRLLLKPASGIAVAKLTIVSQGRMERIAKWVGGFESYAQLEVSLSDILARLTFGTKADKFEQALDELSAALGFAGERPDKEWKAGPDNLWALDDTQYVLWECKNEVESTRAEINKSEAEQMNRSSAWFQKHYPGMIVKRLLVHPTNVEAKAAAFIDEVEVVRAKELKILVRRIRDFFKSFEAADFKDLSTSHIQRLINSHDLSVDSLLSTYSVKVRRAV